MSRFGTRGARHQPGLALAYAMLALVHQTRATYGYRAGRRPPTRPQIRRLALSLLAVGRTREAVKAAEVGTALNENPCLDAILVHALCRDGNRARAESLLQRLRSRRSYFSPYWHAFACAGLGHHRDALMHIRRSVQQNEWFVLFLEHEPGFAEVRALEDYEAVRTRIGLA